MTRPLMLAADHIRELVKPYATHEIITTDDGNQRIHTVHHASLLTQLREATHGSSSKSDSDASKSIATSKPAAHLEAIDLIARIDRQSRTLAASVDAGTHPRLEDRLLAIAGMIGGEPHHRVRSWWAAARLSTHHDSPPLRPHGASCPTCSALNTLRVRLDDEIATCTNCGDVWDRTGEPAHGQLDMLGQHVEWCADHQLSKARHWLTDDAGYPVECTECLVEREKVATARNISGEGLDKETNMPYPDGGAAPCPDSGMEATR